ncbi:hypothetical protein C6Y14_12520 [Streptomyces dioscori]|uniref:Uncharacterized protein n=1 Tax=Streptomyces dioscori TaxID=2109333 RepID=A0A2P8Q9S1_9ACTN|nr:hypothetical protein [Streptomyces dioscori]PSM42993.1 hypothetical protein C6Y14_12520 [Streptomyces dioscori]
MSVAGPGTEPECFPLAEDLQRLMGSETSETDVLAAVDRAAQMLREVYPQVLADALGTTAPRPTTPPETSVRDPGPDLRTPEFRDALTGHLEQASGTFDKQPADVVGKFVTETQNLLSQRNVEPPLLPGATGRTAPAGLETERDAVAAMLYTETKDKADRLATDARSALDIAAPAPAGPGGAPRSASESAAGISAAPPQHSRVNSSTGSAASGTSTSSLLRTFRRGADGRGLAGWLTNEGAPERERELSATYGIRVGPRPEDGPQRHFSHSTLARIDQVLAQLPPDHIRNNRNLRAIEVAAPQHQGAASEYEARTGTIQITLPLGLPSWAVTELNRKSGWQRWLMDQAARADYAGDSLRGDRDLGRLTDRRHVMGGVSETLAQNNFMKWTLIHEIGHSVDERIDWRTTLSEQDRFGGWQHYGTNHVPVATAILDKVGIGEEHYAAPAEDGRRTLLEVVLDALDPAKARSDQHLLHHLRDAFPSLPEEVRRGLDQVSRFGQLALAQPWTFNDGGGDVLRIGPRVYHVDPYDHWVSYLHAERENHALSNYQFSNPKEWFAETYAAFYGSSEAARARLNPAVRSFFTDELPLLVRPPQPPEAQPPIPQPDNEPMVSGPAAGSPARQATPHRAGEPSTRPVAARPPESRARTRQPSLTVPGLVDRILTGVDPTRPAGSHPDAGVAAGRLGPDLFGVRGVPDAPGFLRDFDFSRLESAHRAAFFTAVDLAREARPTANELAHLPANPDSVVRSTTTWTSAGSRLGVKRLAIPRLLHTIWLGGPLRDEGAMGEFRANMTQGKSHNPDATFVLWTDVTRAETEAARALPPGPGATRLHAVRSMLEWARREDIRLVNVGEVFSAQAPMRLPSLYATEAARHTGAGYAAASDILRIEALDRFGGVYSDGDNRVGPGLGSVISDVLKKANGFAIGQYMTRSTNAVLVSAAHHSALASYSDVILHNYTRTPYQNVHAGALMRHDVPANLEDVVRGLSTVVMGAGDGDVRSRVLHRTGPSSAVFTPLRDALNLQPGMYADIPWAEHFGIESGKSWLEGAGSENRPASTARPALTVAESVDVARSVAASLVYDLHDQPGNLNLAHYDSVVRRTSDPATVWTAIVQALASIPGIRSAVTSVTLTRGDAGSDSAQQIRLPRDARNLLYLTDGPAEQTKRGISTGRLLDPAVLDRGSGTGAAASGSALPGSGTGRPGNGPRVSANPWSAHAALAGVGRARRTLVGLSGTERQELFREVGRIMANRHRAPAIIRRDVVPGSPEAHYLALHDDMVTLIAERLYTDPGAGLPEHQRPARVLSEQLRQTFNTHATGGAAAGGIREIFKRKQKTPAAGSTTSATPSGSAAPVASGSTSTPLVSRDVHDWPTQVTVEWRMGQNGGAYVVDAGPAGRAVVKLHEDAEPSLFADDFIRSVTGVRAPATRVFARGSTAASALLELIAQHVPDWEEHSDGLGERFRHVTVSEFAAGVPVHELSVQQRRDLLDNPTALRQLGSLMLVTDFLIGTTDRVGIGLTGHFVNWGNVLYDTRSRQIVAIDNDTTLLRQNFDAAAHAEMIERNWADDFERLAVLLYNRRPGLSTGMPDDEYRDSVTHHIAEGAKEARSQIGARFAQHATDLLRHHRARFPQGRRPDAGAITALAEWAGYRWGMGAEGPSGEEGLAHLRAVLAVGTTATTGASSAAGSPLVMRADVQNAATGDTLREMLRGRLAQLEPGSAEFERVQRVIDTWGPAPASRVAAPDEGRAPAPEKAPTPPEPSTAPAAQKPEPWKRPVPRPGTRLSVDVVRHPQWFEIEELTGLGPAELSRVTTLDLTDGWRDSTAVRDAVRQAVTGIRTHLRDTPGVGLANADLLVATPAGDQTVWSLVAQALADALSHRIKLVMGGKSGPVIEVCPE